MIQLIGPLALAVALQAAPAAGVHPARQPEPEAAFTSPTAPLLRMFAGVALVCAAASGLAYWSRRRRVTLGGSNATIQIAAARSLGPRHRLAVVEVGGRTLLLGLGSESVQLLADLTDPIAFSDTLHERLPAHALERFAEHGSAEVPRA